MEDILAIETDLTVYGKVVAQWKKYGVSIQRVETVQEAIKRIKQGDNHLFIGLNEDAAPDFLSLLPILRDVTDSPIFVTSSSYTIDKNIMAMSLGADAYDRNYESIEHNVLMALEILKVLNRWAKQPDKQLEVFAYGDVILSKPRRKVFINEAEVALARKEFDILQFLMANYGCVVEHEQLLHEIWGDNYGEKDMEVLWRTINRLRVKLSERYPAQEYIKVERGVGYLFEL